MSGPLQPTERIDLDFPRELWRSSVVLLIGSCLLVSVLSGLVLAGFSDPPPAGGLILDNDLSGDRGWRLLEEPPGVSVAPGAEGYEIALSAGRSSAILAAPLTVHVPFTLEITTRQIEGHPDAAAGLWVGGPDSQAGLVVALNADRYLAIWQAGESEDRFVRPWEVFPHIRSLGQPNRVRVDADDGRVVVRLNDELAAAFEHSLPLPVMIGFYVAASLDGPARLRIERLRVWQRDTP